MQTTPALWVCFEMMSASDVSRSGRSASNFRMCRRDYPLVPYDRYTGHSEPSQLARGDLGALRYAPGTVGKLTMSPFHRRIAGFVKLDTREMALVAIRRLPHCQAR